MKESLIKSSVVHYGPKSETIESEQQEKGKKNNSFFSIVSRGPTAELSEIIIRIFFFSTVASP